MAESPDGRMRAFIGVQVTEALRENIIKLERHSTSKEIRFVPKENLHITLFFLGDIKPSQVKGIESVMNGINRKPFNILLNSVGTFSAERPSVIFIRVGEGWKELLAIYEYLRVRLNDFGIRSDYKNYNPHLTIARVDNLNKANVKAANEFVERHSKMEFGSFTCSSINLKRSVLSKSGSAYSDIYVKTLSEPKSI